MTIQSVFAAALTGALLLASPAVAGGPGRGGCGGCGGGAGGSVNVNRNVNINHNVTAGASAHAHSSAQAHSSIQTGAQARGVLNARAYSGGHSVMRGGQVSGGVTYIGSGYAAYDIGHDAMMPVIPVRFVGPAPVSAPVGYPVYGMGRDYLGWQPRRPVRPGVHPRGSCDCDHAHPTPVIVEAEARAEAHSRTHTRFESRSEFEIHGEVHRNTAVEEAAPLPAPPPPMPTYEQAPSLDAYYGDLPPPGAQAPSVPRPYLRELGERG